MSDLKRVDQVSAQLTTSGWRLDHHSALYLNMRDRPFRVSTYVINQSEEHRPDLVALSVYGDPSWWWVLATYNGMINPQREFVMGLSLKVPDFAQVDEMLKAAKSQSVTGQTVEV